MHGCLGAVLYGSPRELNHFGSARLVVFVSLSFVMKILSWVVPTRFRDLCALIENRVWVDWGKHRSLPQSTKNSKRWYAVSCPFKFVPSKIRQVKFIALICKPTVSS